MFEDNNNCEIQLYKDKQTLLEGYVVEQLFEEQYMKGKKFTSGWWVVSRYGKDYYFCLTDEPNEVDKRFEQILDSDNVWYVDTSVDYVFYNNGIRYSLEDFCISQGLKIYKPEAVAKSVNKKRQDLCIAYFKAMGMLRDIAINRYFANNFLTCYFGKPVNIDYINIKSDNRLCVSEVKFKYPTADNHYGINTGEYRMLKSLSEKGIVIAHVILNKNVPSETYSIFDFLVSPDKKYWKIAEIDMGETRSGSVAPEKTSEDASRKQGYVKIPAEEFKEERELEFDSKFFAELVGNSKK